MINILRFVSLFGFGILYIVLLVYFANRPVEEKKEKSNSNLGIGVGTIYIPKIKNGSKLIIGKDYSTIIKVDQHFNRFQKKIWKYLLGIKIEDYIEED